MNFPIIEKVKGGGRIELVEMFGDDLTPARVARISYLSKGDESADRKLLVRLIDLGHFSPFEQQVFRFVLHDFPIYIGEQILRHRIASPMKRSFRYTKPSRGMDLNEIVHIPPEFTGAKRTSIGNEIREEKYRKIQAHIRSSLKLYDELVQAGLRKEAARTVLPFGTRTSMYWTINMRSLMNFLELRLSKAAQWEIRQIARAIVRVLEQVVPLTLSTFLDRKGLTELTRD
jgi:thymidylate synthase (FAD)